MLPPVSSSTTKLQIHRSKILAHIRKLGVTPAAFFLVVLASSSSARADEPSALRLRGDAFVETRAPVGLLVLHAEDHDVTNASASSSRRAWLDAETVTWLGVGNEHVNATPTGDVLTLSVRARDAVSGSEVRVGRMIVAMGAIRPLHLDGVRALGRAFGGTTLETFGGVPVTPRFDYRTRSYTFEWAAGGRLGQAIGDVASFGGSYEVRRRRADFADEEVGADLALTPYPWLTAAARSSFDLVSTGPTDALASISAQKKDVARLEVFTTHRSPGRLLPSTSLFSVLGDFAATSVGSTARWRAFPRLELLATGMVQTQASEVGGQALARTTLAFDDEWAGSVGVEARRVDFNQARWIGARLVLALPLGRGLRAATEIELVRTEKTTTMPNATAEGAASSVWPWALGALAWSPHKTSPWEVAGAVEASAGPEYSSSIHALARLSYVFEREPRGARASASGGPR